MKAPRNITIDLLRGIAMIAMILIHTTYYFIGSSNIALFLWHWSQFAVPIFVFCSGYLFFLKPQRVKEEGFFSYIWKRVKRLVIPYYMFLIFFFPIIWLTTGKLSLQYIWQSLILIGGVDISWLVLLMLELSLVFPLLILLKNKYSPLFWVYVLIGLSFSIFSIFHSPLSIINYKWFMWIGWSLMGIFSLFYMNGNKIQTSSLRGVQHSWMTRQSSLFIISIAIFIATYLFESFIHHDVTLYGNKYPPTLLIVSFGIAAIVLLYFLAEKQVFKPIQKLLIFTSTHSYSLFFIHYCFLIAFASLLPKFHTTWYFFFASVFGAALLMQYAYNKLKPHKT